MKLLVQGDDYGFTKGVTLGMLEGIDHGVLTCSGLFANMPDAEWRPRRCAPGRIFAGVLTSIW